ncbi:MAG: organic solvent ABC transporter permease [Bdellovibrionaceae bacterium]|nr:organic solvent ABC transporter permease [Pseudobdellovibrionaceae bacterium]
MKVWLEYRQRVNASIDEFFIGLYEKFVSVVYGFGQTLVFTHQCARYMFSKPSRFSNMIQHMHFIGNDSIIIIALTGCFTGLALSYQIYIGFNLVNATNLVGPTVALGIFKELAPVLTGLIVAARAGGAMAAQLGTMRVSEQIDALEVMGVNPKQYLVSPRILASFLTLPLLCGAFDFIAIHGSELLCVNVLGLDSAIFWDKIETWIEPKDIIEGLIKSAVFGITFSAICCKTGFYTSGGAKGVGEATNRGVVNSMVWIIILNFFVSNIIRMYFTIAEAL